MNIAQHMSRPIHSQIIHEKLQKLYKMKRKICRLSLNYTQNVWTVHFQLHFKMQFSEPDQNKEKDINGKRKEKQNKSILIFFVFSLFSVFALLSTADCRHSFHSYFCKRSKVIQSSFARLSNLSDIISCLFSQEGKE